MIMKDKCEYGNECYPDDDFELLCDEHRRDHQANRADMRNDLD